MQPFRYIQRKTTMNIRQLLLGLALLPTFLASAFTFDDIHFWVGEGKNRCAVVIDWSQGYGEGTLVWGYRWNGDATCPTNLVEVMRRIAAEDPRLQMGVQKMMPTSDDLYFFGYDVNDCHPRWNMTDGSSSDPEAYALVEDSLYYTVWWAFYGPMNGPSLPTDEQTLSGKSATDSIPQDGDWFVFSWGSPFDENWMETPVTFNEPTAAESPFGYEVIDAWTESDKMLCLEPTNVLGRPTMYMYGQWGGPISPYNPSWMAGECYSLYSYGDEELEPGEDGGPGFVTIKFDHRVVDDPANPYGLDFIVFGNSLCGGNSTDYYSETTDPDKVSFTGVLYPEFALVEVSQDGKTWFKYTDGPFADSDLPTLGLQYDNIHPDSTLFAGNQWWGRATQATKPINPAVTTKDFAGKTLREIAQYYNGSAGGTGYDIGCFDLPKDEKGRKWIQYVRISSLYIEGDEGDSGYTEPEIDAVADVAPASDYQLWCERNYTDWTTAWREDVSGFNAIAANGQPNGVNYLLGYDANETPDLSFCISDILHDENVNYLEVLTKKPLTENASIFVEYATELKGRRTKWTAESPILERVELLEGVYHNVLKVSDEGRFFRLSLQAE